MKRLLALIKRQKKNIIISFVISIAISFVCYLMNNCPYPYWDSLDKYCYLEYLIQRVSTPKIEDEGVYFLDVGYDKQVADCTLDDGTIGTVAVTDRKKLLQFLKAAELSNTYDYIFLDIRFPDGITTPDDDALFHQINKMRDIGYSKHIEFQSTDSLENKKAAINDFYTTVIATNITRYQFIQNGQESAPVMIYRAVNDIDPNKELISRFGPFYFFNGSLCHNSPFLIIKSRFQQLYVGKGRDNYAHLGAQWLTPLPDKIVTITGDSVQLTEKNVGIAIKNKIVMIGDYVNDIHDTYCGPQPGPYLIYLAYLQLVNGKLNVSWPFIAITVIIYFLIMLFIMNNKSIWRYVPFIKQNINNKFVRFVLSLIGYSTLLSIICSVSYAMFDMAYNILFPSLVFSISKLIISNFYKS